MSLGEDRVRIKFNPNSVTIVDEIKQKTADLIDLCNLLTDEIEEDDPHEQGRLISLAMTSYELAGMWAVKAATAGK